MGLSDLFRSTTAKRREAPQAGGQSDSGSLVQDRGGDQVRFSARVVLYDSPKAQPEIETLEALTAEQFVEALAARVHELARGAGGNISYSPLREVIENLVHADFKDPIVTIDQDGNRVRVSDHGSGIKDPEKACERGFTTATGSALAIIKGVGNGLAYCKEILASVGGGIELESNIGAGTVVTLWVPKVSSELIVSEDDAELPKIDLSDRQKKVLFLVMELGEAGPSQVASELRISLSSAYRDLRQLEEAGLIRSDGEGKRGLAALGVKYLEMIALPE